MGDEIIVLLIVSKSTGVSPFGGQGEKDFKGILIFRDGQFFKNLFLFNMNQ